MARSGRLGRTGGVVCSDHLGNLLVGEAMTASDREEALRIAGSHYECDDGWYSCPLSEEGCINARTPKNRCTCGRDARVDAIAAALAAARREGEAEMLRKVTGIIVNCRTHSEAWAAIRSLEDE